VASFTDFDGVVDVQRCGVSSRICIPVDFFSGIFGPTLCKSFARIIFLEDEYVNHW
jgi:hypothetical protein